MKKIRILLLLLSAFLLFSCTEQSPSPEQTEPNTTGSEEIREETEKPETALPESTVTETTAPESTSPAETLPAKQGVLAAKLISSVTELPDEIPPLEGVNEDALRKTVLDYMFSMADVKWICDKDIDYTAHGILDYKAGETYQGMPYNSGKAGIEVFADLIEDGVFKPASLDYDKLPGNNCSSSILHAWQTVSTVCNYGYCVEMSPSLPTKGIARVGEIDWSHYDSKSTTDSVLNRNSIDVILDAYAAAKPADALVRHNTDAGGGHAMMLTDLPTIGRRSDGSIDPETSFFTLIDQNNYLQNQRPIASSWGYRFTMTFVEVFREGYLPVSVPELQAGTTEKPVFAVKDLPDLKQFERTGMILTGKLESNYRLGSVKAELHRESEDGEVVASSVAHPYQKTYSLSTLTSPLGIKELPAGRYVLTVDMIAGLGRNRVLVLEIEHF